MNLEPALFLPIFSLINPIGDILQREIEDIYTRIKLLATQTLSTIRQAQSLYPPLESYQTDLLQAYLRSLYRALGVSEKGSLPCETFLVCNKPIRNLFMPCIEGDGFLALDPWELIRDKFDAFKNVVVQMGKMKAYDNQYEVLKSYGDDIETTMNPTLAYLRNMDMIVCIEERDDRI